MSKRNTTDGWHRTPGLKAGPGNLLNGRWLVQGQGQNWHVQDLTVTDRRWRSRGCSSMAEARRVAEHLARKAAEQEALMHALWDDKDDPGQQRCTS